MFLLDITYIKQRANDLDVSSEKRLQISQVSSEEILKR